MPNAEVTVSWGGSSKWNSGTQSTHSSADGSFMPLWMWLQTVIAALVGKYGSSGKLVASALYSRNIMANNALERPRRHAVYGMRSVSNLRNGNSIRTEMKAVGSGLWRWWAER